MVHEVWNAGTEYEMVRTVQLAFIQEDGAWKINDIVCPTPSISEIPTIAPPPGITLAPTFTPITPPVAAATQGAEKPAPEGWQRFEDAVYGYHIAYPPGWSFQEVEIRSPELAAPVVQIMVFAPQETIEVMNQPGPPDPTKPPVVPPLNVEVSIGAMDKYRRMYPEPATSETLNINGYTVVKEAGGMPGQPHQIRYIFQSSADENLRVTLVDNITGFEARAEGNEAVMEIIQQMLNSFAFG